MYPLPVAEFEYSFVLLLSLRRKHSCRRPLLLVLGLVAESSYVGCCVVYSMYAGSSCDSSAPFYDRYSTQLRVSLFVSLLLGFLA